MTKARPLSLKTVNFSPPLRSAVALPTTLPTDAACALMPTVQEKVKAGHAGISGKLAPGDVRL